MKRYVFAAGVLFLSATFVNAQETTPVVETGVNYSFIHCSEQGLNHYGENGGSGYFEYNLNRFIGPVGDLGGYDSGNYDRQTFSYLFGPRLNWRMSRVVPYVRGRTWRVRSVPQVLNSPTRGETKSWRRSIMTCFRCTYG